MKLTYGGRSMNSTSAKVSIFNLPSTIFRMLLWIFLLDPYNGESFRCDVAAGPLPLLLAENRSQETTPAKASKRLDAFAGSFSGPGALESNLLKTSKGPGRSVGMCLGETERTKWDPAWPRAGTLMLSSLS